MIPHVTRASPFEPGRPTNFVTRETTVIYGPKNLFYFRKLINKIKIESENVNEFFPADFTIKK